MQKAWTRTDRDDSTAQYDIFILIRNFIRLILMHLGCPILIGQLQAWADHYAADDKELKRSEKWVFTEWQALEDDLCQSRA